MDLMELRRALLMGVIKTVGPLSKFKKQILTFPNAENVSDWEKGAIVPLPFEPKIVIFYGGAEENEHIQLGVLVLTTDATLNFGVIKGLTASGGGNNQGLKPAVNASIGTYKIENDTLYICRSAATVYWHSDDVYTFEIYG